MIKKIKEMVEVIFTPASHIERCERLCARETTFLFCYYVGKTDSSEKPLSCLYVGKPSLWTGRLPSLSIPFGQVSPLDKD